MQATLLISCSVLLAVNQTTEAASHTKVINDKNVPQSAEMLRLAPIHGDLPLMDFRSAPDFIWLKVIRTRASMRMRRSLLKCEQLGARNEMESWSKGDCLADAALQDRSKQFREWRRPICHGAFLKKNVSFGSP
jgi:hypothetical protein